MNAGNLIAALPLKETRDQFGDTQADASGSLKITGIPNKMSGAADLRFGPGRLAGEPLQNLAARATFSGSTVNIEQLDVNFDNRHLAGTGKIDTATDAL